MALTIVYQTGSRDLARQLFGRVVANETLARAVGALDGAEVTFSVRREWLFAEIKHLYVEAQECSIRRDSYGELYLYIHELTKRPSAPARLSVSMLLSQVSAAQTLGISRIELYAAGDPHSISRNGYYTWARCGFDARLTLRERQFLPPELDAARTLNELMLMGGAAWWKKRGTERSMVFEIADDSSMMQTLREYARELEATGWKP